jgi:Domain of unknown function DUF29
MNDLYEADLYAWTKAQADALRRRATNKLDYDNLAEEIEDLGDSREHEIESRLENLLLHLLKWRYQPMLQCGSWRSSIVEARFRIARVVKKNPSLKSYPGEVLADLYPTAKVRAIAETGRDDFPEVCPWTIDQVLDPDFLPG